WTGLPECADDTVTDYSRPSPTVESSSEEDQNRNPSASENVASPITPKQKFPTGSTKGPTTDMGMKGKVVKSSACWSWKPSQHNLVRGLPTKYFENDHNYTACLKGKQHKASDNQGVIGARSADDAPIKGRRIDEEEGITGRVSTDTEEIMIDVGEVVIERTILAGGIDVPTGCYSISTAGPHDVDIHTGSDAVPTASLIIAIATIVTPYSRRKGKEVMLVEDFIPMGSKEEAERLKRKGFNLE
nr:hypothetical protein [Tanacetum cinerariifolium]